MKSLTPVEQKFVLHWGEMGTRWGLNRTVAQVHALLFLSPRPLPADEIQEILGVARSNVSTSLRELQAWGIVRLTHLAEDRRDHFESLKDVWEMFRRVVEERKRRELDPTLAMLQECMAELESKRALDTPTGARLKDIHDFFSTAVAGYEQLRAWPPSTVIKMIKLGDKARRLVGIGND